MKAREHIQNAGRWRCFLSNPKVWVGHHTFFGASIAQPGRNIVTDHPSSDLTTKPHRQLPKIRFRVLIIGRANAGKTTILQRVCDTTESPFIYRGKEKVRGPTFFSASLISLPTRVNLTRPWMLVTLVLLFGCF